MNRNILLSWIVTFCWCCTVYAGPVYTDCERPPTILHGSTELSIDDDGVIVTALYKCDAGYHLHGDKKLTCDTDTDVWQGDLPACKLEMGNNSTVSEIETPEAIEPVVTVSPELTHEEVLQTVDEVNTNEILAPPSQAPPLESESESPVIPPQPESPPQELPEQEIDEQESPEQEPESHQASSQPEKQQTSNSNPQKKRRRKGKVPEFQEDTTIDDDFASRLDMSCIEGSVAPAVNDAYIVEYIRAKKDEYKFLVAIYACDEDFYLENPQSNRLYCSQGVWVGNYPICVSKGESDLDYGNETDDDNQHGNDDNRKTDAENVATNSLQQNNENDSYAETIESHEPIPVAPTNNNHIDEQIATNEIISTVQTSEAPIEIKNEITTTVDDTCEMNNGGCEHACTMVPDEETGANMVECSCREGFYLDSLEGKKCSDINECEYPNICPNGCENSIGSYRCLESNSDVEIIPTNIDVPHTTEFNAPVKACGDGLRLDDSNNCIDIDECAEGKTGCEYCQNTVGGFQCTCPDGFELNNDEKTCRDIDECTTFSDYEYEDNTPTARSICSHECINTVGSYICRCPNNYHLRDDKRTCEQDFCKHLNDISANKSKCSHDCVDEVDGYHCKCPAGMKLDVDMKTCLSPSFDTCSTSGDRCLPGKCVDSENGSFHCECPDGFAEYNQRCIDYDECAIGTHKCSHKCKNIDGSYLCECPDDLALANDKHTCVSTDFCSTDNGGCSDICNVVNEKVICSCLDGAELGTDGRTCQPKNICTENNGGCQQVCNAELNRCECFPGFETFDDGKTCRDLNECLQNNGGCPQQCSNTEGAFECTCFEGFEMDGNTGNCVDRNECESNNGNCDHECSNTQGAYVCSCRPGYSLSADQHHCFDTNECEINNGNCSDTCVNLQGSYQCTCPEGYKLDQDKLTCVEIKDSCSALAAPEHGHVRCTRSRHMSQLFYRTKCSFWCDESFTLMGPSFKYCNGTDGIWDMTEVTCVQSACPPLSIQHPGTMTDDCLNGKTYPGQSCALICPPGFKSTGSGVTQCLPNREWSRKDLHCQPMQTQRPVSKPQQQPHLHSQPQAQPQPQQQPQPQAQPQPQPQPLPHPRSHPKQHSKPKTRIQGGETHSRGQFNIPEVENYKPIQTHQTTSSQGATIQTRPQQILRPYIKCPRDTTLVLPTNKKTIYVKLEQPKSNVNWNTHVDVNPAWAKNLQAHLAAGVHTITFRARSPHSASISDVCRTVLTVKSANTVPTVFAPAAGPHAQFCPKTLDIQLQPHELQRNIFWREPQFQSSQPLKQIFKSHLPGTKFGVGHHKITYIATDVRNQNGTCQFTIAVRAAVLARVVSPYVGSQFNHLDNHESYLLCPGKPAMKLDTNFPIQIPGGCMIKNVQVNQPLQYNPHRRRQAFPQAYSPNNNFLRYYSSWNSPEYNQNF